ncbi:MAG: hypothetical protein JW951_10360 [Lentisphaerae bacterium]|nr:hypothetical protein [Lentisphaerota bacterium]
MKSEHSQGNGGASWGGLLDAARRVRRRVGPLWWHSGLLFVLMRFGDLCNLYVGVFLVPAFIEQDKLGAVLPLTRLATFVGLPLLIVVRTSMKFLNVFFVHGERGKIKQLLRDLGMGSVVLSVIIVLYLAFAAPFIQVRLKFDNRAIIWLVGALAVSHCWLPVASTSAQGLRKFYTLTLATAGKPVVRLVVIALLICRLQLVGYLAAGLVSSLFFIAFIFVSLRGFTHGAVIRESYRKHWGEMFRYMLPLGLCILVTSLQQVIEPWIVRQRLPVVDSAGFYIAAMFGFIPTFLAGAVRPFLFPLVSERSERKESTRDFHLQTLLLVGVVGAFTTLLLFFVGSWVLSIRPVWREYLAYAPFVWRLGAVTTLQAVITCHVAHETACRRFRFLWYLAPIALIEVVVLYGLMGWSVFRPWLPAALWQWVAGFDVHNLRFIVRGMLAARVVTVLFMFFEIRRCTHPAPAGPEACTAGEEGSER